MDKAELKVYKLCQFYLLNIYPLNKYIEIPLNKKLYKIKDLFYV